MPINKGEMFNLKDIYVDYPFEEVMYRWSCEEKRIYVKFYGEEEKNDPVPQDNRLYNDALLYGDEISKEEYQKGR